MANDENEKKYFLALDISTSCTGVCLIDENEQLVVLDAVKLTSSSLTTLWSKADRGIEEIKQLVGDRPVSKIFVEANAKMFMGGFSSADTLFTLAKFNSLISYLSHKAFNAEVYDINVSSARKSVGYKNTVSDKRPVKEKVFEFITTLHPKFPWKKHVAKAGKHKNQEVFNTESRDMSDAYVIAVGGYRLNKTTQLCLMRLYDILFEAHWAPDTDSNITERTGQFADLMDVVAKQLGLPPPIITSGLRGPDRQAKAMFNIWRKNGPEYLINLYGNLCASCSKDAGNIAEKLADVWGKSKGFIPRPLILSGSDKAKQLIQLGVQILSSGNNISAHQTGEALDYGLVSNNAGDIQKILSYIKSNNLADIEEIDESGNKGGPHIHITVLGITAKGSELINQFFQFFGAN